jgi:sugar/nucleoside kinase (ribokinase family)
MKSVDVVGLGSCTVDFFAIVPKLLGADEKINSERLEIHAGGVTANNLTQVARLGATTGWFGLVGDDANARTIRDAFEADGMDTSAIEAVKDQLSSITWIPVDAKGERCIYMFPNVTAKITPKQVRDRFSGYIQQARHLHTEISQLPMAPVLEAIDVAKQSTCKVILDFDVAPQDFIDSAMGTEAELMRALASTDVLKPCKAAARELTGEKDPEKMARKLLTLGPKVVAITMGADGSVVVSEDSITHQPAFQVKVVDTTGAGDAYMGGLSYALLMGWSNERAAQLANACAGLCCTQIGARAMSRRNEVEALIESQVMTA